MVFGGCGHSTCRLCLIAMMNAAMTKNQKLRCPMCKSTTIDLKIHPDLWPYFDLLSGRKLPLPPNYTMMELIDLNQSKENKQQLPEVQEKMSEFDSADEAACSHPDQAYICLFDNCPSKPFTCIKCISRCHQKCPSMLLVQPDQVALKPVEVREYIEIFQAANHMRMKLSHEPQKHVQETFFRFNQKYWRFQAELRKFEQDSWSSPNFKKYFEFRFLSHSEFSVVPSLGMLMDAASYAEHVVKMAREQLARDWKSNPQMTTGSQDSEEGKSPQEAEEALRIFENKLDELRELIRRTKEKKSQDGLWEGGEWAIDSETGLMRLRGEKKSFRRPEMQC